MNKYLLGCLLALSPLPAYAAMPPAASYAEQWSRTMVTSQQPFGNGMLVVVPSSTAAAVVAAPNGARAVFQLPVQLEIVSTATAVLIVCATQDPTPIIDSGGYFRVDSESNYSAGKGLCRPVPAGGTVVFGAFQESFSFKAGGAVQVGGGRRGSCQNGAPCNHNGECQGAGVCTRTRYSNAVHIATVAPGGSGIGTVYITEVF